MIKNSIKDHELENSIREWMSLVKIDSLFGSWYCWNIQSWDSFFDSLASKIEDSTIQKDQFFGLSLWESAQHLVYALSKIERFLKVKEPNVLELGSGVGVATFELARRYNWDFVASDNDPSTKVLFEINKKYLSQKKELKNSKKIRFERLDWNNTPNKSYLNTFDLVIASDILYQVSSVDAFLHFLRSLLSKKGVVLITDPGRFESIPVIQQLRAREDWVADFSSLSLDSKESQLIVLAVK